MMISVIRINNQIGSIFIYDFYDCTVDDDDTAASSLERDQNRFLYITQQRQIKYEIIDLSKDSFCVLEREIAQS